MNMWFPDPVSMRIGSGFSQAKLSHEHNAIL